MGFFDKIREYRKMVSQVESNIYGEKQDYLEVYERNQQLEKEIEERTAELNDANKRMLTLQHIWDMMNSSTPLENVLDNAVNSIQGELGYLYCAILKNRIDEDGEYMEIVTQSKDSPLAKANIILNAEVKKYKYDPDGIFADAIKNKKIIQTKHFEDILQYFTSNENAIRTTGLKSVIIIPLFPMDKQNWTIRIIKW